MLPFDFAYYLPQSPTQATNLFNKLQQSGNNPVFFGGGTELISRGRVGNITFDAAIDIKGIAQLGQIKDSGKDIVIGGGATLREITQSGVFPLLAATVKRIADHTIQHKITLAGNLLGGIIYKEAMLPLLLLDAKMVVLQQNNRLVLDLKEYHLQKPMLKEGQLLLEIRVDKHKTTLPWYHNKVVKSEKIDYPLLTLCAVKDDGQIRYAVTGLYNNPCLIDNSKLDDIDTSLVLNDHLGSAAYRIHVLKQQLLAAERELLL